MITILNTISDLTDDEMTIIRALIGAALNSDRVSGAARSWHREEHGEALTVDGGWDATLAVLADKLIEDADER